MTVSSVGGHLLALVWFVEQEQFNCQSTEVVSRGTAFTLTRPRSFPVLEVLFSFLGKNTSSVSSPAESGCLHLHRERRGDQLGVLSVRVTHLPSLPLSDGRRGKVVPPALFSGKRPSCFLHILIAEVLLT